MSEAARDPGDVSRFLLHCFARFPHYIAAQFVIGEGDDQVWPHMAMLGDTGAGLKLNVGDTHAVFLRRPGQLSPGQLAFFVC